MTSLASRPARPLLTRGWIDQGSPDALADFLSKTLAPPLEERCFAGHCLSQAPGVPASRFGRDLLPFAEEGRELHP